MDEIEEGPFVEAVTGVAGARIHTVKLKAPNGVSIELLQYLNTPSQCRASAIRMMSAVITSHCR